MCKQVLMGMTSQRQFRGGIGLWVLLLLLLVTTPGQAQKPETASQADEARSGVSALIEEMKQRGRRVIHGNLKSVFENTGDEIPEWVTPWLNHQTVLFPSNEGGGYGLMIHFRSRLELINTLISMEKKGEYPLLFLVREKSLLIWEGKSSDFVTFSKGFRSGGYRRLYLALREGDVDTVKQFVAGGLKIQHARFTEFSVNLNQPGAEQDINAASYTDLNALHLAAMYGHRKLVDYLLTQGFSLNDRCTHLLRPDLEYMELGYYSGTSILLPLIAYDQLGMTRYLIEKGADVNARDDSGYPVIMDLVSWGDIETVKLAMTKGADLHAFNPVTGEGTLHFTFDDAEMIKFLLKQGVKANRKTHKGVTTLIYNSGNLEAVKLLVKAGADPHHVDDFGQNALFYDLNKAVLEYYLSLDLDPNLKNTEGESALDYLKALQSLGSADPELPEMIQMLEKVMTIQ